MVNKNDDGVNYDVIAHTYAANRNASETVVAHILEAMRGKTVAHVLEIGCGTADHLYALSGTWGIKGCGFDQSPRMIEEGASKNPGLDLHIGDASTQYPYPDAGFDFAFSVNVIHYIADLPRFFAEACRILKPGGIVLTVTDSEEDIRNRLISFYFPETVENELKRYPTIQSIIDVMHKNGFEKTWITHTEHLFRLEQSHLERYQNKAYSALRLIPEAAFQAGMQRLTEDVRRQKAEGREVYTCVWGQKAYNC